VAQGNGGNDNDDVFIQPWFRDAHAYCNNVQRQAFASSTQHAIHGWVWSTVGLTGASLSTVATAMSSTTDEVRVLSASGIGFFSAVTAFGIYWLARSVAADHAATASIAGLEGSATGTPAAWQRCLEARLNWTTENAKATEAAVNRLQAIADTMMSKQADGGSSGDDGGSSLDAATDGKASEAGKDAADGH
jgi:hypothetical protein